MNEVFDREYSVIYERCLNALEDLGMNVESSNKNNGVIEATTGTSLLSWGESVNITIRKIGSNKTKVEVVSKSSAQLISWGKNESNETKILQKIKSYI